MPVVGLLPQLRHDALAVFQTAQREHGDFVRLQVPGRRPVILIGHPDYVRRVLQDHHANYGRTPFHDMLKPVLGNGLVTSEGELWRRQRRLVQPAFQSKRIRSFVPVMAAAAAETAERWQRVAQADMRIDLAAEMSCLTLTIILRAMFHRDDRHAGIGNAVQMVQEQLASRFWSLTGLFHGLPTPANRRFRRALATLDAAVAAIIAERSEANGQEQDLLAMLLAACDEETGTGMDPTQLRDEVMTMFLAGHETSAAGLSWAWYLLTCHPEAAERVREEARSVLAGHQPVWEDVERLAFTRMVVQETLRLYPPIAWFGRRAVAAGMIDGYEVPAGSTVLFSPYVVQRDARFWAEPERFVPERFAPDQPVRLPYSYFPFGGGPRTCIGAHFAMTEMVVTLATLVPHFEVSLGITSPIPMQALITLRPAGGLSARIAPHS
ncbi:cytochrome P450 [Azospirillum canadense]|uniref:cytochrome P450 n=1 Tax=Azospirillum canadense TaxID=403962 RepID=UPI002227CD7A|nr:cytochrome P450 [Azospirillum canadense]MCW2242418.1 cytochrome P450 [Azospirillum canadense]